MRFLFVDRILRSTPGESIYGLMHITHDSPYLSMDDAGRLYFTTSLVGEALGQLAAWNVMAHCAFAKRPVAGMAARATMHRRAYLGETLLLEAVIDALDEAVVHYHGSAYVGDDTVFTADGALGPLLPMEQFIDPDIARAQYDEIFRPGEWPVPVIATLEPFPTQAKQSPVSFAYDALLSSEPGVSLSAVKKISRAAQFFPDHFPRKPVLPMTVLLECKLNLAREFVMRAGYPVSYVAREMRRIKMSEFVYPGDMVTTTVQVKHQDDAELILQFRSAVDGKRVCVMELLLTRCTG